MRPLLRLYRVVKPALGRPGRWLAHAVRRHVLRDPSQLGEALAAAAEVRPCWPRWVVDVGANDGITVSNSYRFVSRGWDAVLIEPNPERFARLEQNMRRFPRARLVQMACAAEEGEAELFVFADDPSGMLSRIGTAEARGEGAHASIRSVTVPCDTLTNILARAGVPGDFALLSIDTEGLDHEILRSLDPGRFRPRLIITETDEDAETEEAKAELLGSRGYVRLHHVGVNSIWKLA